MWQYEISETTYWYVCSNMYQSMHAHTCKHTHTGRSLYIFLYDFVINNSILSFFSLFFYPIYFPVHFTLFHSIDALINRTLAVMGTWSNDVGIVLSKQNLTMSGAGRRRPQPSDAVVQGITGPMNATAKTGSGLSYQHAMAQGSNGRTAGSNKHHGQLSQVPYVPHQNQTEPG